MISLDLLRSFLVFSEAGGIVAAAARLGITQPALSAQLARLAEELPTEPFAVEGRRKVLSAYGRELEAALRSRLLGVDEILRESQAKFADETQAELRVAGRREVLAMALPRFASFRGRLEVIPLRGVEALEALGQRRVDLILSQRLLNSTEVVARRCFSQGLKLAIPKAFFEGGRAPRSGALSAARGKPWRERDALAYTAQLPHLTSLLKEFEISAQHLRLSAVCEDWAMLARLCEQGRGWTVLPRNTDIDARRVWCADIPEDIEKALPFYASYRKESAQVPWFKNVLTNLSR